MDLIIWRESFETGYVRVDSQHKHLVHLINEIYKTIGAKNKQDQMRIFFIELFNYTLNHFSMEEILMKEFKFEGFEAHKEEHYQFIIKLKDFKEKYLEGQTNINLDVLNFLRDWLLKHIMGTDKRTFEYIKAKTANSV